MTFHRIFCRNQGGEILIEIFSGQSPPFSLVFAHSQEPLSVKPPSILAQSLDAFGIVVSNFRAERLYRELDCIWPRVTRNLDFGVTRFHGGLSVISVVVITKSMWLYTLISLQYHAVSICYLDISFGSLFVMFALVIRYASDWLISGGFRIWFGLEV